MMRIVVVSFASLRRTLALCSLKTRDATFGPSADVARFLWTADARASCAHFYEALADRPLKRAIS